MATRLRAGGIAIGRHNGDNLDGTVNPATGDNIYFVLTQGLTGPASLTARPVDPSSKSTANALSWPGDEPTGMAPEAEDDSGVVTNEDSPVVYTEADLLANDFQGDGPATITWVGGAFGGTVVLNADRSITFTPTPDYNGGASFSYEITDANGDRDNATVSLTVTAVNDAPVVSIPAGEFLVNEQVNGNQERPAVFALSDGRTLFVWQDGSGTLGDASGTSIKGRIFSAEGAAGSEFLINSETLGNQELPAVTELSSGGFVVTWMDSSGTLGDASVTSIKARVFDSSGNAVAGEFLVNSQVANGQYEPQITALSGDRFVITWYDDSRTLGDNSELSIKARIFEGNGTPVAPEFLVNQEPANSQFWPNITTLSDGSFLIVWHDNSHTLGDPDGNSTKGRIFSSTGAPLAGEFLINTQTGSDQREPAVSALAGGGFVVTWEDGSGVGGDPSFYGIKAQIFDSAGQKVGGELLVNTEHFGDQRNPTVAGLADGGFVVTWRDPSGTLGDSSQQSIKARVYDSSGVATGGEFLVNDWVAGGQHYPVVTAIAGGGFAITWYDASGTLGDSSGTSIKAKIFGLPSVAATEQVPSNLKGTISVADADAGTSIVTATLSVGYGVLDVDAGTSGATVVSGSGTGTVVISGTIAQLNALLRTDATSTVAYTPDTDTPPASTTLTVTVNDGGTAGQGSDSATINIAALNDAPTLSAADSDVQGTEDSNLVFSSANSNLIAVDDRDGDTLTVTLTVTSGTLTLSQTSGLDITAGADGSATMTFEGTVSEINAALAGLIYRGNLNFQGADTLEIDVTDGTDADDLDIAITLADDHKIDGSALDDDLDGTGGDDVFYMNQPGTETLDGMGGNDGFYFGAFLDATDVVDGGVGTNDQVGLQGNYGTVGPGATAHMLGAGNLLNIEVLTLLSGGDSRFGDLGGGTYDYNLKTVDGNVANGKVLTITATGLQSSEDVIFDASAETNGVINYYAGKGNDTLTGGLGNDAFFFGDGGRFTAADSINGGGGGNDQVALRGDYVALVGFTTTTLTNVEALVLISGSDTRYGPAAGPFRYNLKSDDGNVADGQVLSVTGSSLTSSEWLSFDGSSELDGMFSLIGGKGNDVLIGGAKADSLFGGLGLDALTGGLGNDVFVYTSTAQSFSANEDIVNDFASGDLINLQAIDANTLTAGNGSFGPTLGTAFNGRAGELIANDTGGGKWLVEGDVDGNGGADFSLYVQIVDGHVLSISDFVL